MLLHDKFCLNEASFFSANAGTNSNVGGHLPQEPWFARASM